MSGFARLCKVTENNIQGAANVTVCPTCTVTENNIQTASNVRVCPSVYGD